MASVECGEPLVDHVVIAGAPGTLEPDSASPPSEPWIERTYAADVLSEYPESRPLESKAAIAAFCMPYGLRLSATHRPPRFACFVLTLADGSRMYGHCLTVDEPLDPATLVFQPPVEVPPGWRQGSDGGLVRIDAGAAQEDSPPPAPPAQPPTHRAVSELLSGLTCYAPRCVCLLSRSHFALAFRESLHTIVALSRPPPFGSGGAAASTALSHLVLNVPRPVSGGPAVRFQLSPEHAALHVGCAPPHALPATDYSVASLLNALRPQALLRLLGCVMLEYQIVVVSEDDELRMAACETIQALLHPLQWMQVYVPTVPDSLLDFLSTPFPCLIGLRQHQTARLPAPRPERMVVVDLDAGELSAARLPPPPLPHREASPLLERLSALREQTKRAAAEHGPAARSEALELAARNGALELFASLLRDVSRFFPLGEGGAGADGGGNGGGGGGGDGGDDGGGGGGDDLDAQVAAFVAAQPPPSRAFLTEFCQTQAFLCFVQPMTPLPPGAGRGGRCYQLALDGFLSARIKEEGGRAPTADPEAKAAADAAAAADADAAAAATALHEVPLPRAGDPEAAATAAADAPAGVPTSIVAALEAAQLPLPRFEGVPLPPLHLAADLRAQWATALSNLELKAKRRADDQAKAVAGVSAGAIATAAVATAALACTVQ